MQRFYRYSLQLGLWSIFFIFAITPLFAYEDVPSNSPYYRGVDYLRQQKIFPDSKRFHPEVIVNKADFIKYLVKINGGTDDTAAAINLPFTDTENTASYAPYFQKAIDLGILPEEKKPIYPYKKMNRLEALELLFKSKGIPIPRKTKTELPYEDLKNRPSVQPLIVRAMELNLVTPKKPDYFGLYNPLSRGEAAQMIYRLEVATIDLQNGQMEPAAKPENPLLNTEDQYLKKFIQVWELIKNDYYRPEKIDQNALIDAALKEMVKKLGDPYSSYLTPEENKSFQDGLSGEVEGIGAFVASENEQIIIVAPIKDSPAYKAGVKAGDIIKEINEVSTAGMSLQEAVSRIKGKRGTSVTLKLERGSQIVNLSIIRDVVTIKSAELDYVAGNIAHLKLIQFGKKSVDEFRSAIEVIQANHEIKGVILDLRDNPGGFLDAALGILNYILPAESVSVNVKYNHLNFSQYSTGKGELSQYPLVVLINRGSASASEIVAGAIKDLKLGKIVGETSFGKGTVQEINFFGDNSSIKLTIAEWLTSLGNSIQEKGVEPDIVVQNTNGTDLQLQQAIGEIEKMKP